MIDSLFAKYSRQKDKNYQKLNYQPHDAIRSSYLLNPASRKLVVIFPGWHTHKFPVGVLARRLAKRGWTVMWYDFHDRIIDAEVAEVRESFEYVASKIAVDIKKQTYSHPYHTVHLIGISLGNVAMSMTADKYGLFSSATFVAAGDDLAVDMWHGLRTLYLRDEFKKEHISLEKLDTTWKQEAPKNHVTRFKGKDVKLVLSKADKFILPQYQMAMMNRLKFAKANVVLRKRRTGHIMTILRYCLIDNVP